MEIGFELSVQNKSIALAKSFAYFSLITLFFGLIAVSINSFLFLIIPYLIWLILSIKYVRRNSIKKVQFINDKLYVTFRKQQIEIPLSLINNISKSARFSIDIWSFKILHYNILFSQNFEFGNELIISFDESATNNKLLDDPLPMKIIFSILKGLKRN